MYKINNIIKVTEYINNNYNEYVNNNILLLINIKVTEY